MTNYDIVKEYTLENLIDAVDEYIKKGYIPIGGVVMGKEGPYIQTMFNPNVKIERVDI